ncbi:MAG: NAD(P)/FAD-dependent oxidoreductase, partial [Gammaproteobacteria bacterium]
TGPVARFEGGYICPAPGGAIIGATMEVGRGDAAIDPASVQRIRELAARALPAIRATPFTAAAGVRAATPDNRPLVGRGVAPGVWLATGARRNGWLLAPMIAQMVTREVMGGEGDGVFDPRRFEGQ